MILNKLDKAFVDFVFSHQQKLPCLKLGEHIVDTASFLPDTKIISKVAFIDSDKEGALGFAI